MANKKNPGVEEVQVVKKKPRGGNSPVIGDNGLMLDDGDNSKFMKVNIALFNMEEIDLHEVDEVTARLNDYFKLYAENDMKPTVAGMAMALGMNRRTLWAIAALSLSYPHPLANPSKYPVFVRTSTRGLYPHTRERTQSTETEIKVQSGAAAILSIWASFRAVSFSRAVKALFVAYSTAFSLVISPA